ncbi:MAG TPA: hypothetical protein VG537_04230, partial [Candidatus Kapabacteria bacterium]|nr:hypothetical protein [Candidatus Kapabacteria bacterium]
MPQTATKRRTSRPTTNRPPASNQKPSGPTAVETAWQRMNSRLKFASAALAGLASLGVLYSVLSTKGFASFPLDDAWIHLTFARTLAASGHFAYGPLNPATSGSTSPLFTFLESFLFLVTKNEFVIALLPSIL